MSGVAQVSRLPIHQPIIFISQCLHTYLHTLRFVSFYSPLAGEILRFGISSIFNLYQSSNQNGIKAQSFTMVNKLRTQTKKMPFFLLTCIKCPCFSIKFWPRPPCDEPFWCQATLISCGPEFSRERGLRGERRCNVSMFQGYLGYYSDSLNIKQDSWLLNHIIIQGSVDS